MPLIHLFILSAIQGITEFLPISSSGHLILIPHLANWPEHDLTIDVAVHLGTLLAVLIYFHKDLKALLLGLDQFLLAANPNRKKNEKSQLIFKLIIATIPIVIVGFIYNRYYTNTMRSIEIIGWTTLIFAILLFIADKYSKTFRTINSVTLPDAVVIGLSQTLALIPGTSRAGITITAARFLGIRRLDAAKFSIFLSIPVIFAASILKAFELYQSQDTFLFINAGIATGISFIFALITVALMMKWLQEFSFTPFVVYRLFLGLALIFVAN